MTMTDAIHARHALALTLAQEAGALALAHFTHRDALEVETKANPQDVVSRADREVEDMIRARLAQAFPGDAILGEEGGGAAGDGFTWVIDPIDGTMPFLSGLPHWCVAIAVTDGRATVSAVTHAPVMAETYDAVLGGGARLNGVALHVDPAQGLAGRMTAIGGSHRAELAHIGAVIAALLQAGGMFYRNGSGALMLAQVAAGRLAGYYEPHMNAWDCLGGMLMVAEAGGGVAPFDLAQMLSVGAPVLAAAPAALGPLQQVVAQAQP
ncbi:MAG: inositol monophosphatase [Rhodobacterales bacterium]|nr:inositol monophosphatase [Rhodobacterales bacterium]